MNTSKKNITTHFLSNENPEKIKKRGPTGPLFICG
jgi:hypothetical protein